ncbi:MAG: hypothetical protein K2M98_08305, partial [Muribaculum sp.]|nr:hypothetical protein [Muribaculum sp.]
RTVYIYDKNVTVAGVRLVYIEGDVAAENILGESEIVYPAEPKKNYTPKNPENVVFNKAVNAWDYTTLSFEVEAVNTDGDDLNTDNLYYAVYFDHNDSPVEFKKSGTDYYYLTAPMTYVPYNFVDYSTTGADFMVDGNKRTVYIYDKNVTVAGVRLVYIEGDVAADNILGESEIVYPAEPKKNYTPKNPENVVFKKAVAAWDYTTLSFEVEAVNTDGDDLNTDNLYYAVYFDHNDSPVEFKKSGTDYYYLTAPMTYVPYNFVDYSTTGADFMVDGNKRTVYIYDKNVTVAGVRLVYIEGDVAAENILGESEIVYPAEPKKNYTPKNPENVVFNKAVNAWDYTTLSFEVEAVNTDGDDLNTDNLYYAVYFDHNDSPVEFKKSGTDYYYLTAPMTYVPYNFVDYSTTGADFMVDGNKRTVYIYDKNVTVAGVRLVYIEGDVAADNILGESEIVYPAEPKKNYTPKNPENVVFKKAVAAWDYTTLSFEVEAVNTDGDDLNTDNLYYAVYFDHNDSPVEFKKSGTDYYYLTAPMTYVPYNFVDYSTTGADFMVDGNKRTVYIYDKNVTVAGVRLVYIEGDVAADNILGESEVVYPTPVEPKKNYTPKNPENVVFNKAVNAWDYTTFSFEVEAVNTDGDDLNTDNLYYAIYFDNSTDPFEFKRNGIAYYYITEPMTYVPFNFVDYGTTGADFSIDGNKRTIYVFDNNVTVAGVRLVYIEGDVAPENILGESEIVYPSTSGIDSIYDQESIVSTVYYNAAGVVINNPTEGIYIKVVTYNDGKVETTKVRL